MIRIIRSVVSRIVQLCLLLCLSQLLSLMLTSTGVLSTLLAHRGIHIPTTQAFVAYALLSVYLPVFIIYKICNRANHRMNLQWYWYIIFALFDVEANFLVVKAYQYTSITSVLLLLNSCTIPIVMLLSFILLRRRYHLLHYLGVLCCLCGIGVLVVDDLQDLVEHTRWFGDLLCLLSALCYSVSNVGQEWCLKRRQRKHGEQHNTQVEHPTEIAQYGGHGPDACGASDGNNSMSSLYMDTPSELEADLDMSAMSPLEIESGPNTPLTLHGRDQVGSNQQTLGVVPHDVDWFVSAWKNLSFGSIMNSLEYVAFIGAFGSVITLVQLLVLERDEVISGFKWWSATDYVVLVSFGLVMFVFYSGVPLLLNLSSATFMNLNLLTNNVFAMVASVLFFDTTPSLLYIISFALIALGILLYNIKPERQTASSNRTQSSKHGHHVSDPPVNPTQPGQTTGDHTVYSEDER